MQTIFPHQYLHSEGDELMADHKKYEINIYYQQLIHPYILRIHHPTSQFQASSMDLIHNLTI